MKKLIIFLLLLSGAAYGQTNNTTNTKFTNGLAVPNGVAQKPTSGLTAGALSYVTGAGLYVYNGSAWELLGLSSGGVTSFNGRTGVVTPLIGDYSSFYVPLTRSLTINGATQTLAADRTWTVTANTTNSLTAAYGLTGGAFDGSVARTWVADTASVGGLVSKLRLATNLTGYVQKPTTITINGVTQDLSANRTYTVGSLTSITPGYGLTPQTAITSTGTFKVDTAQIQTVANFFPKGDTRWGKSTRKIVYVSDYGDTYLGAVDAIKAAGDSGVVVFSPGITYLQTGSLMPLVGQEWIGNGSILKRVNETITTLSVAASAASSSFTVSSVPASWEIGDNIYINQDSSSVNGIISNRIISNISGNVITLTTPIGGNTISTISTWPIGTKVQKVFHQITNYPKNLIPEQSAVPDSAIYPFTINGFNIDGSKIDGVTASWYINNAIFAFGRNIQIRNNNFYDMGNDCVDGHGFLLSNNTFNRLNNSVLHLTSYQVNPFTSEVLSPIIPAFFYGNYTDSTNLIESTSTRGSRHSEGVITSSTSGGYINIENNRINNANNAFFGNLIPSGNVGAKSASSIVVTGNYIRNVNKIFFNLDSLTVPLVQKSGNLTFVGNTLDSCRTTTWPSVDSFNYDKYFQDMLIDNNLLLNGTVWTYPLRFRNNSGNLKGLSATVQSTGTNDADLILATSDNGRGMYVDYSDANKLKIYGGAGKGIDEVVISNEGALTAPSLIKTGGTSSQFLKADGSVDGNTYLTSAVTSIAGTADQITASASTGPVTLSLPSSLVAPGRLTIGTSTFTTGGGHIYYAAANGVVNVARTGSATDWILVTQGGGNILEVPTGTTNARFGSLAGTGTRMVVADNLGILSTQAIPSGGGGGTVASVSVNSANGFAGTSSGGANPALTLSTTVTGMLKGNGTNISAATAGTDYVIPSGTVAQWSGNTYSSSPYSSAGTYALTFDGSSWRPTDQTGLRSFLGLGSNAYTSTSYAPLASPTFTGTPSLPTGTTGITQTAADNSTKLATTAYVDKFNFDANTFTPTLTLASGLDGATPITAFYQRINNIVSYTIFVTVDPTSASACELGISLPIASDFNDVTGASGVAQTETQSYVSEIDVTTDVVNNRLSLTLIPTVAFSIPIRITGHYKIQ